MAIFEQHCNEHGDPVMSLKCLDSFLRMNLLFFLWGSYCMCHSSCMANRWQVSGMGSLFPPCQSLGSNSGFQSVQFLYGLNHLRESSSEIFSNKKIWRELEEWENNEWDIGPLSISEFHKTGPNGIIAPYQTVSLRATHGFVPSENGLITSPIPGAWWHSYERAHLVYGRWPILLEVMTNDTSTVMDVSCEISEHSLYITRLWCMNQPFTHFYYTLTKSLILTMKIKRPLHHPYHLMIIWGSDRREMVADI